MENITKNMPDVNFIFYGDKGIPKPQRYKNVELVGWVDIKKVIERCSCLVRFTAHDGLPTAPMEFLMSGRYVITNADMPYVEKIEGTQDTEGVRKAIIEKIREIKKKVKRGIEPSKEGGEYYRKYLEAEHIKKRIYEVLEK